MLSSRISTTQYSIYVYGITRTPCNWHFTVPVLHALQRHVIANESLDLEFHIAWGLSLRRQPELGQVEATIPVPDAADADTVASGAKRSEDWYVTQSEDDMMGAVNEIVLIGPSDSGSCVYVVADSRRPSEMVGRRHEDVTGDGRVVADDHFVFIHAHESVSKVRDLFDSHSSGFLILFSIAPADLPHTVCDPCM